MFDGFSLAAVATGQQEAPKSGAGDQDGFHLTRFDAPSVGFEERSLDKKVCHDLGVADRHGAS